MKYLKLFLTGVIALIFDLLILHREYDQHTRSYFTLTENILMCIIFNLMLWGIILLWKS